MSSRPRFLALSIAPAACGDPGDPDLAVDGREVDAASPDAPPPPHGLIDLGARAGCPSDVQVTGDRMYWFEGDALYRSAVDTCASSTR